MKPAVSRPSRARGLKHHRPPAHLAAAGSRPSRARGLKPRCTFIAEELTSVAPLTGAWIETKKGDFVYEPFSGRAPHGRVD